MNKTKTESNIEAIKLLKKLQQHNRIPTETERAILGSFIGWGTIHQMFNSNAPAYAKECLAELESILSKDELRAAQNATINAHYTPDYIASAIWEGVQALGFTGGLVFEPGCGHGNFIGAQPFVLRKKSQWYGVELDAIAGGIAQKLYPDATIYLDSFENVSLPDGSFDLIVGNVPFGNIPVIDPKYSHVLSALTDEDGKSDPNIHCYFVMKSLSLLKEGGLLAIITSTGLLDAKGNQPVRRWISQRATLVGALRLPNTAFKSYSGTEVTTDLIILKRTDTPDKADWVESIIPANLEPSEKKDALDWQRNPSYFIKNGKFDAIAHLRMNPYYLQNPQNILGVPAVDTLYGGERAAVEGDGRDLSTAIEQGFYGFGVAEDPAFSVANLVAEERVIFVPPDLQRTPVFQFVKHEGNYYERLESTLKPVDAALHHRIGKMLDLYNALDGVIEAQKQTSEGILEVKRSHLNEVYNDFIEEYGYLNYGMNPKLLGADPRYYLLMSLEKPSKECLHSFASLLASKEHYQKADIFFQRTARPGFSPDGAASAKEALLYSLNQKGKVDISYIASLLVPSLYGDVCLEEAEKKAIAELEDLDKPLIFFDPASEEWVTSENYLSGNVRAKLAIAQKKRLPTNVTALEAVQPKFILPPTSPLATTNVRAEVALALGDEKCESSSLVSIEARLGTTWIPVEYKAAFANYLLNSYGDVKVYFAAQANIYDVKCTDSYVKSSTRNLSTWGAYDEDAEMGYTAIALIKAGLNLKDPVVRYSVEDGDKKRSVVEPVLTNAARKQLEKIEKRFAEWLWADMDRAIDLTKIYNERFNAFALRKYDGSHLTLPGMNPDVFSKLYPHQLNAIWRSIQDRTVLFHHPVGAGKTFEFIASIMEAKRLGLAHKPMMVVLNSTIDQIASAFKYLYPTANILVADKKSYESKNRKRFMTQIATGNWDCIIVTYPQFLQGINVSEEAILGWFGAEIDALEKAMWNAMAEDTKSPSVKMLASAATKLQAIAKKKVDDLAKRKDNTVLWEQLGVDHLTVDESHSVKNLWYSTKMLGVAGLPNPASQRALDCFLKVQSLLKTKSGRVIFGSATPISNSLVELWTNMRFLANDMLISLGLDHFDSFASAFGKMVTGGEVTATGYKIKKRFSEFFNVPEVVKLYSTVADILPEWKLGIKKPVGKMVYVKSAMSEAQIAYQYHLYERALEIEKGEPRVLRYVPDGKNGRAVLDNKLVVTSNGRQCNLDVRLVSDEVENFIDSKLNNAALNIFLTWKMSAPIKGAQLVFCDFSTPNKDKFNAYHYLKSALVALGIPADEVQFIQDFKADSISGEARKRQLFEDVNNGIVRVLFGSTETLGTGVNVQKRLVASHQLDVPWRPSDVTQRVGRVERCGNLCSTTLEFRYTTEGFKNFPGFDAYLWQMLERKQKGFSDVIYNPEQTINRTMEGLEPFLVSAAFMKANATGDDRYVRFNDISLELDTLRMEKESFESRYHQAGVTAGKKVKLINRIENELLPIFKEDQQIVLNYPQGLPYSQVKGCENPKDQKEMEKAFRELRTQVVDIARKNKEITKQVVGAIAGHPLTVTHQPALGQSLAWEKTTCYVTLSEQDVVGYEVPRDDYKQLFVKKEYLLDLIQARIDKETIALNGAYADLKEANKAQAVWEGQEKFAALEAEKLKLEDELGMSSAQEYEDELGGGTQKTGKSSKQDSDDTPAVDSSLFDTPNCAPYEEIDSRMVESLKDKLIDYAPEWLETVQEVVAEIVERDRLGIVEESTEIEVPLTYGFRKFEACNQAEIEDQDAGLEAMFAKAAAEAAMLIPEPVIEDSPMETDEAVKDYFDEESPYIFIDDDLADFWDAVG